ncbi:MAG TPA: heavy metal-binding domain-containing protein [Vicinamibacterales bacterium]|nr:heavy metal-binding domain-containing protein [Vicinamibacterales bacterium]
MNTRAVAVIFVLAWSMAVSTAPLPAISWTCPMHPDIVEDKKGACPVCKMELVPVRLAVIWTCPVHGVIEQEAPGKCRICGRDLVQSPRALTFTCAGHPEINQIDQGRCADGQPMTAKYTPRPHGDHNPKHGGLFFMAPDNWHHIEGTYPAAGRFRVYVYDDYTRPLSSTAARKIRGRVVTKEVFDASRNTSRELASAPLVLARSGAYFEARIESLHPPAQMTAKISFTAGDKDSRFDFTFPAYSKDVSPSAAALAAAPTTDRLPKADSMTLAALLADLRARDKEAAALVANGPFGGLYVPALRAKDVALAIQALLARQETGPSARRNALETHVKQLVVAAYQLDNFGDLGNAEKIREAYLSFSTAVTAIGSLVEGRQ